MSGARGEAGLLLSSSRRSSVRGTGRGGVGGGAGAVPPGGVAGRPIPVAAGVPAEGGCAEVCLPGEGRSS